MTLDGKSQGKLSILLAACLMGLSCERGSPVSGDRMVTVGSHRLLVHLEGEGTPTVVIEAGPQVQFSTCRIGERLGDCPRGQTRADRGTVRPSIYVGRSAFGRLSSLHENLSKNRELCFTRE